MFLQQNKKAKEWLLLAVTEAERALGAKTGVLKLRYVYDKFIVRFPVFSKFITFEMFSNMVDEALIEMRHYIETSAGINAFVNKTENL